MLVISNIFINYSVTNLFTVGSSNAVQSGACATTELTEKDDLCNSLHQ